MKGFVVFSDSSATDEVIVSFSKDDEILSINDVSDLTKVKKVFIQLSNSSKKKKDQLSVGNSIVKHKIFVQGVLDFSSLESIKRGMRNEIIWVHSYNNIRNGHKNFVGERFKSASQSGMLGLGLPIIGTTVGILSGGTIPIIVGGVVGLALQFNAWNHVNKAGAELDDHLKTLHKK
jgi:hypothetical protein